MSAQNSDFRSGLNLIGSVSTAYGRADVFRRQQLPSQSAFLNMVKDLIAVDEDNVWNYPLVLAASQTRAESFFSATENRLRTSLETQGAPAYLQPANDLVWLNAVKSKDRKEACSIHLSGIFGFHRLSLVGGENRKLDQLIFRRHLRQVLRFLNEETPLLIPTVGRSSLHAQYDYFGPDLFSSADSLWFSPPKNGVFEVMGELHRGQIFRMDGSADFA